MINGENIEYNDFDDNLHAINIHEVNEALITFFDENIDYLFDINRRYIDTDVKIKIFSGNEVIGSDDWGEILAQLYYIYNNYEYITYSFNIESPKERGKNFDGIFLKNGNIYYMEVKTLMDLKASDNIKSNINDKITEAARNALATKIENNEHFSKLENYVYHHVSSKDRKFDYSLSFDKIIEKVSSDIENKKFNLVTVGTVDCSNNIKSITLSDITKFKNSDVRIREQHNVGISHSIRDEFSKVIREKYE